MHRLAHENTASARDMQKTALAQNDRFSKRFIYYLAALLVCFWDRVCLSCDLHGGRQWPHCRHGDRLFDGHDRLYDYQLFLWLRSAQRRTEGYPRLRRCTSPLTTTNMALPSVKITIKGGGLGRVPLLSDGVAGLLITGELTAVPTINNSSSALQRAYDTPVQLGSVKDLEALSLEPESNSKPSHALIQRQVEDFYNTAGDGAQLWLMLLPKSGTAASFTNIFWLQEDLQRRW